MALTRTYVNDADDDGAASAVLASASFDSTGYDYVVAFVKHEGATATLTVTDNKISTLAGLTKAGHANGDLFSQFFWGAIGTPGTGHIVTFNLSGARAWKELAVWLIDSAGAVVELDVQSVATGTGTACDAGSLITTAAAILLMGVGGYTTLTFTESAGWVEDSQSFNNFKGSRAEAASGTFNPLCTASASTAWAAVSVALKEAAGGEVATVTKGRQALLGVGM